MNGTEYIAISLPSTNKPPSPRSQLIKTGGWISKKKMTKITRNTIVLFALLALVFYANQLLDLVDNSDEEPIMNNGGNTTAIALRHPLKFNGPSTSRQKAVVKAFRHAWKSYRAHAWGHDDLKPLSKSYNDWLYLGATLVDSLDTMYIMGLTREFEEARLWVKERLSFIGDRSINLFETTIRVLGGLLSTYHLSGDSLFLEKAVMLGERLLPVFSTPTGIPYSDVNLGTGVPKSTHTEYEHSSIISEAATLQMEFRELSRASGNSIFEESSFKVSKIVHGLPKREGLVPIYINFNTGKFIEGSSFSMAGKADSYYEYLLKQWIQTGRTIDFLRDDYKEAIAGAQKLLARRSKPNNLLSVGELDSGNEYQPKLDHLVCFLPGTLALGVHYGMPKDHLKFAEDLLYTCYQSYMNQPTRLAPESSIINLNEHFKLDMSINWNAPYNLLRPETIESLWYLYVLTGNTTYQDWGWEIFQAFERNAKVDSGGYSSLSSVARIGSRTDKMESFFLGETLKYLYLLFGNRKDNDHKTLSLDKFVLNTEAHFFPIHSS